MIHARLSKVLIVFVFLSSIAFVQSKGRFEPLLEIGNLTNEVHKTPDEIKIVSYNIRWRGGDDLKRLIALFKNDKEIGGASIIGLQEVDRNKKRTRNENTVKTIAHSLKMNYAWAAPPNAKGKEREEEETGVAILSKFPISDVTRIVLPNEGPGGRYRTAVGATVQMGKLKIRVYSVHAETRISTEKKVEQLNAVIQDLNTNHKQINRAMVLGDFNTILPDDVEGANQLFSSKGFETPFAKDESTWKQFFVKLKLDWLWLRGIKAKDYGIDKKVTLSDHYPLWVNVNFSEAQTQTTSKPTNEKLREELLKMADEDQQARKDLKGENFSNQKLIETMNNLDLKNIARLKEIVAANKGFPTAEQVGKDGVGAALLILQHSPDWDFQKEMLPAIEAAAKRGDVHPHNYTNLVDRVRLHFGQKQLYGTQASIKDGKLIVDPIEDEQHVDERRKALGLSPLDEYLKDLAEMYKLPVERKPKQ